MKRRVLAPESQHDVSLGAGERSHDPRRDHTRWFLAAGNARGDRGSLLR